MIHVEATDGEARAGWVETPRGRFPTPVFMPVGTKATVRSLDTVDLENLGADVVLANTYHLMLRPTAEIVQGFGGLHGFMDWSGHVLTDSGGYQIFSLEPKIDEDGALFKSTYDGSKHRLTPETSVRVQAGLGADISMALDVCPGLPATEPVIRDAMERTHRWADRARAAFLEGDHPDHQLQFGIVQGGIDPVLRAESAEAIVATGFDGYAIGGLSVGEAHDDMVPALAAATSILPPDRARYLMGVGDPAGLIDGVANGVDMFDCVLPTRLARHGMILTDEGRINLRNAKFATDPLPLDPLFPESPAARYSRGYLRHLLMVHEVTAGRILTLHNVAWVLRLVDRMRVAIREGRFEALRQEILAVWG